ncbi:hypothetical protein S7335_4054 [Synechococcus sp. PCC 7335]|uniref:hypothetical protein n=1 Tax=Synechococcus sp. (strain ATCC 29403 / PCC 7335) TaxID=91464 RepID=UPI00017EE40B|nr:hypothetical protein [Synechococcus sp. PCC 7335]EDX86350.1 hypothetical protein S7335_4054 [Synechococcus sp. PCC 7335]
MHLTRQQFNGQQPSDQQTETSAAAETIVLYSLQPVAKTAPKSRMTATWTTENDRLICKWQQLSA